MGDINLTGGKFLQIENECISQSGLIDVLKIFTSRS